MKVISIGSDIALARKLNSVKAEAIKAKEMEQKQEGLKEPANDRTETPQSDEQKGQQATRKEKTDDQQAKEISGAKEEKKKSK